MSISNISERIGDATFVVDDDDALLQLIKAIRNVNNTQKVWVGEYVMMISTEDNGHRVDVKWFSEDERIVFADEWGVEQFFTKGEDDAEEEDREDM